MAFSGWASKESNLFGRWSQEALMGEQRSEAEKGEKPQLVCSWAPEGPVTGDPRRGEACSELSFPRRRGAGAFIGPVLPSASGLRLLPVSVSSGTSSLQCPGREDSSNQKRLSVQHSLLQLEGVKLTYTRMIRVQGITASMQWHSVPLTALPCGVFLLLYSPSVLSLPPHLSLSFIHSFSTSLLHILLSPILFQQTRLFYFFSHIIKNAYPKMRS